MNKKKVGDVAEFLRSVCFSFLQYRKQSSQQAVTLRHCSNHVYEWVYRNSKGSHDLPQQHHCFYNWDGEKDSKSGVCHGKMKVTLYLYLLEYKHLGLFVDD